MNVADDKFVALNNVKYLYLRKLSEPMDNSLQIVVQEAVENRAKAAPLDMPGMGKILPGDAWPIESTSDCRTFVLSWTRYVAYLVTEEAAGSCGNYGDEIFTGKLFRQYQKSHMLDHIACDTGGHFEPLQHYKIICLNHLIDIVSTKPPVIEVVASPDRETPSAIM